MKFTKILGVVAVAAMALMAFASTASATTLETNGVAVVGPETLKSSLVGSATLRSTGGAFANTCKASTVEGTTNVTTGAVVSGPVSALSFTSCTHEKVVVNAKGSLSVERIGATTNGTVRSQNASVTVPVTVFGSVTSVTCTTAAGAGTDIGTLEGKSSGTNVTHITISAVLSCSGLLPTANWEGTYVVTGNALGVGA
jgi:hypothetical protein